MKHGRRYLHQMENPTPRSRKDKPIAGAQSTLLGTSIIERIATCIIEG